MTEPTAVTVAGRYELGARLGVGGMAQVFRARDLLLERQVAVKIFGPSVDPHGPDRVRDEMRTLAMLSHPGLVPVFDAGTDEPGDGGPPRAFLVMALIDGLTLGQRIAQGPLPPAEVATLGAAIADALGYVHSRGVVHRDLKPANVLLDGRGQPYLADFGIARTLGQVGHTATGLTIGTASFLSPEQVLGRSVGTPADVYAFGLVLLESLTARREYPGQTAETALVRLSRPPRVDPGLPAPWPALLTAMTELDPAARPPADAVAEVLRGRRPAATLSRASADPPTVALAGPPVTGGRTEAPDRTRVLPAGPPRVGRPAPAARSGRAGRGPRRRLVAGGVAAAAVLAGLALALGLTGSSPAPASPAAPAPSGPPGPAQLPGDLARLRQLVTP